MQERPRGYKVISKRSTAKAVLYFVRRWGRRYVIKEYTDYRFSDRINGAAPTAALRQAERRTEEYFLHLQKTARLMRRSIRRSGLLNIPLDVFRYGRSIYKVTVCIEQSPVEAHKLHECLTHRQMNVFLRTLLLQLEKLEEIGFIHCDLKPENVMICQRTKGVYSAAVIDYDSGIILGDDDEHYVDYTPEYAAPELHLYKEREQDADALYLRRQMSHAADMFAAACLIVYYLTGISVAPEGILPCELLLADRYLRVPKVHPVWRTLLQKTLRFDLRRRLNASQMLAGLDQAERSGLMDELNAPLADCGGGEKIDCGGQTVLLRAGNGCTEALWYLDEEWVSGADGGKEHIWMVHDRSVRRRRAGIKDVCEEINPICDAQAALFPVYTAQVGRRFFALQTLPVGRRAGLRELGQRFSVEEADRFMSALLGGVSRLHEQGLLCCLIGAEDVWGIVQEDGSVQPVLGGLHRVIRREDIPDREEIDIDPQIAAPEVCMYLGRSDVSIGRQIAELIGEQSDLFSMGAVYHMLLCGRLPEMIDEAGICLGEAVADASGIILNESIDERRRGLICRMLADEPQDRPESCGEVLKCIASFSRKEQRQKAEQETNRKAEQKSPFAAAVEMQSIVQAAASAAQEDLEWTDCEEADGASVYVDADGLIWESVHQDSAADELIWSEDVLQAENAFEEETESRTNAEEKKPKGYVLSEEAVCGAWRKVERASDGCRMWAHRLERETQGGREHSSRLKRIARQTRQMHKKCSSVLPIECISRVSGAGLYSIACGEYESIRSMADETPDAREIDIRMQQIVKAVQAVHENGLLCGAVTAENAMMIGGEVKINIAECAFAPDDERDAALWREWMAPLLSAQSREKGGAGAYLSPEAKRMIAGGSEQAGKSSDIFALGVLYHALWCDRLPDAKAVQGDESEPRAAVERSIPFAQRMLMERMLSQEVSKRPQDCGELLGALERIISKRGKTHSVTVKRNGEPIVGKKAWLYAELDGRERFVASAMTDRSGKAVFSGYLPEGKYYVRCDGERVTCRWRKF